MKRALAVALLLATPAFASVSIKRSVDEPKSVDVAITDEPLASAVKALEIYLPHRVVLQTSAERDVTFSAKS